MDVTTIFLPGLGGSGPDHWQSRWQAIEPAAIRFAPTSWDAPDLDDWIAALDRAVATAGPGVLLVAHSLGALLVPHWAARRGGEGIVGAFLVAPPDVEGPAAPPEVAGFRDVPQAKLPFPALLVFSRTDPYASPDFAARSALGWRAGQIDAGELGHINVASGHGYWAQGAMLLTAFRAGLRF